MNKKKGNVRKEINGLGLFRGRVLAGKINCTWSIVQSHYCHHTNENQG